MRPDRHANSLPRCSFWCTLALPAFACASGSAANLGLRDTDPRELRVTSGRIEPQGPLRFAIRCPTLRAELGAMPRASAEIRFVYRGPSAEQAPLASGELRRQIGLKLRAQDTCNVVYVMWRIEPAPGIEVSVKTNPGQHTHAECRDRGYRFLTATRADAAAAPIALGSQHSLQATIADDRLQVTTDARRSWVFSLPAAAHGFDGPVGIRSDNGRFDVELRASAALQSTSPHARANRSP